VCIRVLIARLSRLGGLPGEVGVAVAEEAVWAVRDMDGAAVFGHVGGVGAQDDGFDALVEEEGAAALAVGGEPVGALVVAADLALSVAGSQSSSITWSRSSHDSNPTWQLSVADHHCPEECRWPWYEGNARDGRARSNATRPASST
jgi:hypothetical protein